MTVAQRQLFRWTWQGTPVEAAYEVTSTGTPVLLLPAFSTVSSREEMRPLAALLAQAGFACTLMDWPGFGASTRGRLAYGPPFYARFLADFCAAVMPTGSAVIAAGHASGYALALGPNHASPNHASPEHPSSEHPSPWRRIVLLAPTWRGPLPTAMGPHPRAYAAARTLVRAPLIGEALYRLNTHPRVISMMYQRHVYADADQVTPAFTATKQGFARQPGARFASVAFVTGALDPLPDRASFQALLAPPPAPTLIVCGTATPPKSKAEMAAITPGTDVQVQWVPGSLGLYEESARAIAGPIIDFLHQ